MSVLLFCNGCLKIRPQVSFLKLVKSTRIDYVEWVLG
jgi:hypothetical protein